MTRYISLKETNVLIRQALKAKFPGTKFSVVGDSYSGGASTNVRWTDGPSERAVKAVAGEFAGASFDGMTDMKSYHASEFEGEQVYFGADFVFVTRNLSQETREAAAALLPADLDPGRLYYGDDVPQVLFKHDVRIDWNGMWGSSMVEALAHKLADEAYTGKKES